MAQCLTDFGDFDFLLLFSVDKGARRLNVCEMAASPWEALKDF